MLAVLYLYGKPVEIVGRRQCMKTTRLGNTGLEVSRLCLGCMTYGDTNWRPWILGESDARVHFQAGFRPRASTSSTPPTCTRKA